MKKWEISVLVVEVLIAVMLALGIFSVIGERLGNIFRTVNTEDSSEYASAVETGQAIETVLATRSLVLVDLQNLVAHPHSYQGKWVKIRDAAEVLHIYSPTEFTIGTPSDSIYVVWVIPDQSNLGFSIVTPPPDFFPNFHEHDYVWLTGLVGGRCKGHYPAKALICGKFDGFSVFEFNKPTPTRTPPPWWQFWLKRETPIPTGTPLPW